MTQDDRKERHMNIALTSTAWKHRTGWGDVGQSMIFAWFFLYAQLCELTLRRLRVEWHHHFRSHSPPTGHSGHALLHLMTWTHTYMYLQNRSGPGCWLVNTDLHLNLTPSLMGGLNGRVLGGARDGRLCHDRVGVGWFVHGFELQTLVMDPEIRWFQVFRRALVLVGAGVGLTGCTLPENTNTTEHIEQVSTEKLTEAVH